MRSFEDDGLESSATDLLGLLKKAGLRIVLAESCTAGLVAASIGGIPGASHWFCGSLVSYQDESKKQWLGVEPSTLSELTAVSGAVARQMAAGALVRTARADWAFAITGHLGPGSPPHLDGKIFLASASRTDCKDTVSMAAPGTTEEYQLTSLERRSRQRESSLLMIGFAIATLSSPAD